MLPKLRKTETWPSFVDEFFNRDLWPAFFDSTSHFSVPAVNILEDEKEFKVELVAPGIDKKDVDINLEDDILTISSEKEMKSEEKDGKYMRREFNYTSFSRSFVVPEEVDAEKISAEHKNGILTIHLPKKEQEIKKTRKRQIRIV
ncbi:MAG: Hsp20/alpha crystallin family protein [Chlorobi bacterium]|nr:Hsp20/alpha crystallin family protein [Chlorobiota bacterium]